MLNNKNVGVKLSKLSKVHWQRKIQANIFILRRLIIVLHAHHSIIFSYMEVQILYIILYNLIIYFLCVIVWFILQMVFITKRVSIMDSHRVFQMAFYWHLIKVNYHIFQFKHYKIGLAPYLIVWNRSTPRKPKNGWQKDRCLLIKRVPYSNFVFKISKYLLSA